MQIPWPEPGVADLGGGSRQRRACAITQYSDILKVANESMSADLWARTFGDLKSKWHRVIRKANGYLALATFTFRFFDAVSDLKQSPYARRISVFAKIEHPSPSSSPTPVEPSSEPTESIGFEIGDSFADSCVVAWPTAPLTSSTSITMRMSCSRVPMSTYLFTDVTLWRPNLPVTPSTGSMEVRGTVVGIADSGLGFTVLVVEASDVEIPSPNKAF